jgi:hypothetical protein
MCAVVASCSSLGAGRDDPALPMALAAGRPEAIVDLRLALVSDPRDARAHAALGLLLRDEGLPGAALRELRAAEALGDGRARKDLAALYLQRARQRARLLAPQTDYWQDFERARSLDPSLVMGDRDDAFFAGGAARWAAGDTAGATELWRTLAAGSRWERLARAALSPREASLSDLGAAALALAARAPRGARSLFHEYVQRGGKEAHVLRGHARGEAGAALPHETAIAALDTPPETALPLARTEEHLAGQAVADVLCVELAGWLWGSRESFLDASVQAFVAEESQGRSLSEFPAWARPTLLRARGDAVSPRVLDSPGRVPAYAVPLWAVELAVSGRLAEARAVLGTGDAAPLVWLTRARLARVVGDEAKEREAYLALATRDPRSLAFDPAELVPWWGGRAEEPHGLARAWRSLGQFPHAALDGVLARWRRLVGEDRVAAWEEGAALAPLGQGARPLYAERECLDREAASAFSALQTALRANLAVVDRMARDYADAAPSAACRGKDVVALLLRLGDTRRARAWIEELLAEDRGDVQVLLWGVEAAARARDAERAQLYLEEAEYVARTRGAPSLAAVDLFWDAGLWVEAAFSARQALALSSGPARWAAYEKLVAAALRRGKQQDAQATWQAYLSVLPPRLAKEARARVQGLLGDVPSPVWLGTVRQEALGEVAAAIAEAEALAATGQPDRAEKLLEERLAWSPGSVALRRALASLLPKGSPRRYELAAELLFLGLCGDARARDALGALAQLAAEAGLPSLAKAARDEAWSK